MIKEFATASASFFFLIGAQAANWYVRPAASGSNNGTDWNNAWTISSIGWGNVKPGDTVWLAGGNYSSSLKPAASGVAGNLIYIKRVLATDGVPSGAAGWSSSFDSQVVLAPPSGDVLYYDVPNTGSYMYIDGRVDSGIKLQKANTGGEIYPGCIHFADGSSGQHDITFSNIDMAGPFGSASSGSPNSYFQAFSIRSWSGSAFNQIGPNILVTHCRLHGSVNLAILVNATGVTFDSCKWYDNLVGNSNFHQNMCEFLSSGNITWKNCEFYNWAVEGIMPYGNATGPIYIYGCVFHDGVSVARVLEPFSSYQLFFYNNTIYNVPLGVYSSSGGGSWSAGSQARNNIYWNVSLGGLVPPDSDYEFSSGSVSGAHSISSGSNPFVNLAGADFHLTSTIGAKYPRDKGVAMASTYSTDRDGNIRGTDGAWDVGAYEYSVGGPSTNAVIMVTPPSRDFGTVLVGTTNTLTFSVQNVGGATLTGTASVPAPFSIVSGGTYSLAANQSQNVTVRFVPLTAGPASGVVSFTGGGGATAAVTAAVTLPAPTVSAITQSSADVDPGRAGLQIFAGSVVQYSGSASDPSGLPLTWQWIYTVNGGPEVVLQSGAGTVPSVSFNYVAGAAGNSYVWKLRVSNGTVTSESALSVGVEASPPPAGTLTFAAGSGILTAPFAMASGYVSQSVETGVTNGGQAVYGFTTTNSGDYVIQALVNAANDGANSFYVNIDGQPQDPDMICDLPLTTGFEQRIVSWRGNGTFDNDQFIPKVFTLAPGPHQLVVVGREANVQLQSLSILLLPTTPRNVHVVASP